MQSIILASVSVLLSIAAVCILAFLGWYIVWTSILCQFKFVQEVFHRGSENPNVNELKTARSKTKRLRKE